MTKPHSRPPPSDIGAEIRKIRESLSLTQEQFAQKLGVSTRTVARWESGLSAPRATMLNSLGLGSAAAAGIATTFPFGSLVAAVVGGMLGTESLRHTRQQAALKAVLRAIASEHKVRPDVLQGALQKLLAEMLDQGVSQEELLDLLREP